MTKNEKIEKLKLRLAPIAETILSVLGDITFYDPFICENVYLIEDRNEGAVKVGCVRDALASEGLRWVEDKSLGLRIWKGEKKEGPVHLSVNLSLRECVHGTATIRVIIGGHHE